MSDILHARTMSFNGVRAMRFGWKPTVQQRAIMLRSDQIHMEFQFSTRYGGISFSSTMMDDVGGCRFKMIEYSHPEYWDAVYVPVAKEQEAKMFAKACEMADYTDWPRKWVGNGRTFDTCHYKSNHVKYDLAGAAFSYWTQWEIWKPSKLNRVCNRAVTEVVLTGHPRAMNIASDPEWPIITADYASMTPSETDAMFRNYFSKETNHEA